MKIIVDKGELVRAIRAYVDECEKVVTLKEKASSREIFAQQAGARLNLILDAAETVDVDGEASGKEEIMKEGGAA